MMKVKIIITIFSVLIISCSNGHKSVNPDNIYSHIIDYCESHPIDSSRVYTGEEDYIPYCYLGLNGKSLKEIVNIYGQPLAYHFYEPTYNNEIWSDERWQGEGDDDVLSYIFQKIKGPIPMHVFLWKVHNKKPIYLWLYFVTDHGNLRTVFGMRMNTATRRSYPFPLNIQ